MKAKINLEKLVEKNLPTCNWQDLFEAKSELSEEDKRALEKYFSAFLPAKNECINCGKGQGGGIVALISGNAMFQWGIAHGEGFCSNCGYPGRALHYDVGPIKQFSAILQYHPSQLVSPPVQHEEKV